FVEREGTTAAAIAREIELKPTKTHVDFMDLGTAHLWEGHYLEAAQEYEVAARQARNEDELAAALYAKAGAAAYAGQMPVALRTADLLVRLRPDDDEPAWLRFALYRHSGDALGLAVAGDHVLRTDPAAGGHEVFAVTGTALAVAATVTLFTVATAGGVAGVALTPPEERREVALQVAKGISMMGVAATLGTAAVANPAAGDALASLGRALVEAQ
ncbi:MAG: hypothetical protein HN380_31770, partial [Victivallales bacterium]|nr:hypothetical protein [Victivallales bacterium]